MWKKLKNLKNDQISKNALKWKTFPELFSKHTTQPVLKQYVNWSAMNRSKIMRQMLLNKIIPIS